MWISHLCYVANLRTLVLLLLLLGASSPGRAGDITYFVDLAIGGGGVTGEITTDGTVGIIGDDNIVDWDLLLADGTNTASLLGPLSGANSEVVTYPYNSGAGIALSATATELLFNFSATDNPADDLVFLSTASPINGYLCIANTTCNEAVPTPPSGYGAEQVSASPNLANFQYSDLSGTQVIAAATPEPSTLAGAGIALLGFQVLRNKQRRRRS
jgi:hypothetical protein